LSEAEKVASQFKPDANGIGVCLELSEQEQLEKSVDRAFDETYQTIIRYPKIIGQFINDQLIRGGFVALMASEKRGKTFWLLDMAIRARRQGAKVAFFQAGDMTESQQMKRLVSLLAKKTTNEKYAGDMLESIPDCVRNQNNSCDKSVRECDFGIFEAMSEKEIREEITMELLTKKFKATENKDYKACWNCSEYSKSALGAPWLQKTKVEVLTAKKAKIILNNFFVKRKRKFKLATYSNGMLSVKEINAVLNIWERQDGFVPDCIVIDYADLIVADDTRMEHRHQQNDVWKKLRGLSQEKHCLVITATQADAASYEQARLRLKNFSEDKRKYAHVTAMYGLNQDPKGREKKLNIMVLNEIVIREGNFSHSNEVKVLQNLSKGSPCIASFW